MVSVRPGRGLPTSAPAWPTGERSTPAGLGGCPEQSRPFSSVQTSCPAWRRIDLVNTRRILSRCASVDAFDGGWGGCPEWSRPFSSVQTSSLARRKIDCVNANCILSRCTSIDSFDGHAANASGCAVSVDFPFQVSSAGSPPVATSAGPHER